MSSISIRRKLAISLLIPITMAFVYASAKTPVLVERAYSERLYLPIGRILSRSTGIIPISIAEATVILVPAAFLVYTLSMLIKLFFRSSKPIPTLVEYAANLLASVSILLFLFMVLWGFNYYRLPFAKTAGLEVKPSSVSDLKKVCISLVERANALRALVSTDSEGNVDIPGSSRDILNNCYKGYNNIAAKHPYLGGNYGNPKPILLSQLMNYTGICGVYFPFTGEANVNIAIPDIVLPSTASHEMAHQRGFAREDEANYISYLACTAHPDANYKYSGIILALTNSMSALYHADPSGYHDISKNYSKEVYADLSALNEFWKQYEGPVERATDRMNNTYLKANNQKDGVKSYGRMVDLLIAEYKAKK